MEMIPARAAEMELVLGSIPAQSANSEPVPSPEWSRRQNFPKIWPFFGMVKQLNWEH